MAPSGSRNAKRSPGASGFRMRTSLPARRRWRHSATAELGLIDVIVDATAVLPVAEVALDLEADDRELLLVKLLREVLFRYDTQRWLVASARVEVAEDGRSLRAVLRGERLDERRHE